MFIGLTIFVLALSANALAGWGSGGGKIHRDSLNPWFLENTSTVRYCIDIDEDAMGVTKSTARMEIKASLAEWKRGFDLAKDDYYSKKEELVPYGQIRVATQRFLEVECSQGSTNIDLRFQLGTLTSAQREKFADPKEYIGIAFREHYDLVNLRAKGFIYIAPTSGTLRPNLKEMHPNAWSEKEGIALRVVLLHETGHIFGIGHQTQTVMDEMIPEVIVQKSTLASKNLGWLADQYLDSANFFGYRKTIATGYLCGNDNPVNFPNMFGLEHSETACGRILQNENNFTVWYAPNPSSEPKVIASAKMMLYGEHFYPAVHVYLPSQQKVFTKYPKESILSKRLYGESRVLKRKLKGILNIPRTRAQIPLLIDLRPGDDPEATVIWNGKFLSNAFYFYQ